MFMSLKCKMIIKYSVDTHHQNLFNNDKEIFEYNEAYTNVNRSSEVIDKI
jgi:hypothetical protein